MRMTSTEKIVGYINRNLGKELTTVTIARNTKTQLRRVQQLCKTAREKSAKKVAWTDGKTITYRFRTKLTIGDIR